MTFQEAKEAIKQGFATHSIELLDEHDRELFYRIRSDASFRISEASIQEYSEVHSLSAPFAKKPTECSIVSVAYREHLVQFLHPLRSRFLPARDIDIVFGEVSDDHPYVQIGPGSTKFIWTFLFADGAFFDWVTERLRFRINRDPNREFVEEILRPMTIKVHNINAADEDSALRVSDPLIDACLFSYASLKESPIGLMEEWPRRRAGRTDRIEPVHRGNTFSLPAVKFNPHLVSFYQLAASTDIPSYKFLSYYHILEYHFVSVSDQILYDRLSRRINDLRFKTTATNLDRIIQDVNDHRSESDETEMLKNVLAKYVIEDELIEFIRKYEEVLGENIYTKKRVIFGTEIAGTNLATGHVFGVVAKHIKATRNALVHSSDRHERNSRFIPYSAASINLVEKEVPVVKFLAEKVIVATAE